MKHLLPLLLLVTACGGATEQDFDEPVECVYDVPGEDEGDCPAHQRCVVHISGPAYCADYSCSDPDASFCPEEQQ
jgi:hypothetical protein